MRSEIVFQASRTLQNRYLLCQITSKASRGFHRPHTRMEETTNDVLNRISNSERSKLVGDAANANAPRGFAQAKPMRD